MRIFKKILSNIHRYVFCALMSVVIWAWIFTLVTDAPRAKKVTVLFDTVSVNETALRTELKKHLPEGLRTVKVYHISYMDMSLGMTDEADIYVLPGDRIEESLDFLCPIGESLSERDAVINGEVYGWYLEGARSYAEFEEGTDYFICFTKGSLHLGELNGSKDSAAVTVAGNILELP